MQLRDSFRAMTEQVQQAADRLCGGKLVMVHEGGYAESYVPFCGPAVMEALSGIRTEVRGSAAGIYSTAAAARHVRAVSAPAIDRLAQQFAAIVAHAHVDPKVPIWDFYFSPEMGLSLPMKIISVKTLRDFWAENPDAEQPLKAR